MSAYTPAKCSSPYFYCPYIKCRLLLKEHKVVSLQLRNDYLEDSGEEYVPTSDKEEDKEEKEQSDSSSLCESTCGSTLPPPLPPRTLAGEGSSTDDEDDSTFLSQGPGDIRLEVSREFHHILQSIGNQSQEKLDGRDEKPCQPPMGVSPLTSSNDYKHKLQQRLEPDEEEYEKVMECHRQSSQHIYQPLLPPRLETASGGGQDSEYQTLQR